MIKFGTDGWRAVISDDFTFENVRVVAQAIADYYKSQLKNREDRIKMLVGYDTRFLSDKYARAIASVFAGNGIEILLSDRPTPTPAVSVAIKKRRLTAGIMVTASHNPYYYNGIKIKADFGGSVEEDVTNGVENLLNKGKVSTLDFETAKVRKLIKPVDIDKGYFNVVLSYVDIEKIRKSKLKVAWDLMWGTGSGYINRILDGSKVSLKVLHGKPDALFNGVSPEPIPKNLGELSDVVKSGGFDIGIANDGDVDRICAVAPDGEFILPGKILCLLLLHFLNNRGWKGAVIKTVTNTTLIDKIAAKYNLKLYETPVGFKHIARIMREDDILIGGEESGGIGVKNYIPERDGTLLGLLLLEMLASSRKGLRDILKDIELEFGRFCYSRIDVEYPDDMKLKLFRELGQRPPRKLIGKKVVEIKSSDGRKFILEDESWLVFRLSGTEPILRIYAEAHSQEDMQRLLKTGKRIAFAV